MRHAGPADLDRLEPLLAQIRDLGGLTEKKRGTFYRKSRAFLHFHQDPKGLHADLRLAGEDFDRFRLEEPAEQAALIARIKAALTGSSA